MLWKCVLAFLALASATHSSELLVHFKTGTVVLKNAGARNIGVAATATAGTGSPGVSDNMPSSAWGSFHSSHTYLLVLPPSSSEPAIAATVHAAGGIITGYVPDSAWLVVGTADVLAPAAASLGGHLEDFKPEYRVAPAWGQVLQALQGVSTHTAGSGGEGGSTARRLLGGGGSQRQRRAQRRLIRELGLTTDVHARVSVVVHFAQGLARVSSEVDLPRAAREDWAEPLAVRLQAHGPTSPTCTPVLTALPSQLVVTVCTQALQAALDWLSQQRLVAFLEPHRQPRVSAAFASMVCQAGGLPLGAQADASNPQFHPFWRMGLDGSGEIIGIGDTGLDMGSCWFGDPSVPFNASVLSPAPPPPSFKSHPPSPPPSPSPSPSPSPQVGVDQGSVGLDEPGNNLNSLGAWQEGSRRQLLGQSALRRPPAPPRLPQMQAQALDTGRSASATSSTGTGTANTTTITSSSTTSSNSYVPLEQRVPVFRSTVHRKVVQYVGYSTLGDEDGHGTHVCGTAAGAALPVAANASGAAPWGVGLPDSSTVTELMNPLAWGYDLATGAAPGAKLAFFDVSDRKETLDIPLDLGRDYFGVQYAAGVRIHSDSWGVRADLSQYTGLSASVDAFLWEHPDVLLIAAAGNRGTISAPSPLPAPPPPTTPTLLPPSPPTPSQMQPNSQAPADKGNKVPQAASDGQSTPWSATAQSSSKAGASTDTASEGSIPDVGASSGASASISTTGSDLLQTGTVEPPATAKNSLAVGAAVGLDPSGEPGANLDATVTIKAASGEVVVPGVVVRVQQGGFGRHEGVIAQPLVLVVASPLLGCSPLQSPLPAGRVVVMMERGVCTFTNKAHTAMAAGAVALIVVNNQTGNTIARHDGTAATAPPLPVSTLSLAQGGPLLAALSAPGASGVVALAYPDLMAAAAPGGGASGAGSVSADAYGSVAAFSSYGPTTDGRIKPDIIAPGTSILAAAAVVAAGGLLTPTPTCSTTRMSGTSMAAPMVAGGAALARQYFVQGFYPTGRKRERDAHVPSGALLKAVLLAGASAMGGVSVRDGRPLTPPPSVLQGFGRLDLTRALPLVGNAYGPVWSLQVLDRVTFTERGATVNTSVVSTGGIAIVCLVWYDHPAAPFAAVALVNDLDLEVAVQPVRGAPTSYHGNSRPGTNTTSPGSAPDRVNTVERVVVENVQPGSTIIVKVTAFKLPSLILDPTTTPTFALVILGRIRGTAESPFNPAVANANNTMTELETETD